jgi:hypothetical protein
MTNISYLIPAAHWLVVFKFSTDLMLLGFTPPLHILQEYPDLMLSLGSQVPSLH